MLQDNIDWVSLLFIYTKIQIFNALLNSIL